MSAETYWTVEDLAIAAPACVETGRLWNGQYAINYSSILTKLIQEAGRWCLYYASDLFISWNSLLDELKSSEYNGGRYVFAFREMGVDHDSFIESKMNSIAYGSHEAIRNEYRAIWALDVEIDGGKIIMTLCRAYI